MKGKVQEVGSVTVDALNAFSGRPDLKSGTFVKVIYDLCL